MREGIRLGKLFGIDIGADYSWAFVFLLMVWNLTAAFGHWHPSWTFAASVGLALVAAMLFFASVVAHELAHALVARTYGIPVHDIRLFLFGGVSNIEREPPSPRAEFMMAIVGPLVSLGIGLNLLVLAAIFLPIVDASRGWEAFASLGPVLTLVLWLGTVNLVVGTFNLIPGFPLDGGRILRAALWAAEGDLHKATLQASNVGQAVGWGFVVAGIAMFFGAHIPFFGHGPVSGLWLAFVGWFLSSAAQGSYRGMLVQDVLAGVRVENLMRRSGYVLPSEATVASAVREWFMRSAEHAFPVVDESGLLGIVAVGDVRKVPEEAWARTSVSDIMTPVARLTSTTPSEDAATALRKLSRLDVEQLPVLAEGRLVGMLERRDVARWLEIRLGPHHLGAPRTA